MTSKDGRAACGLACIAGNTATLNYEAQYLAVGGGSTSGFVTTYPTYSMQYN